MDENDTPRRHLSPTSMTIADAAKLLTVVGASAVTEETLREDIGLGAPSNPDGTLNIVHYAAWLVREVARGN